jgi:hypothetical protein
MTDFKVIIKKIGGDPDEDEHTYWGSVFIKPEHIQLKELSHFEKESGVGKVSAEFSFPQNIIAQGDQFVASVYGFDNEDEDLNVAQIQVGKNQAVGQPEVIEFSHNP